MYSSLKLASSPYGAAVSIFRLLRSLLGDAGRAFFKNSETRRVPTVSRDLSRQLGEMCFTHENLCSFTRFFGVLLAVERYGK